MSTRSPNQVPIAPLATMAISSGSQGTRSNPAWAKTVTLRMFWIDMAAAKVATVV